MKMLKLALCASFAVSAAGLGIAVPATAAAHDGALDSMGCHYARAHRNYHCHEGTYAGMEFQSKGEAMRNFARLKHEAKKRSQKEDES